MQEDTGLIIEQSSETLMIKINCKQQMLPHGGDKHFFFPKAAHLISKAATDN